MAVRRLRNILTLQPLFAIILPFFVMLSVASFWVFPEVSTEIEGRQRQLSQTVGVQVESYLATGAAMIRAAALIHPGDTSPLPEHQDQLQALLEVAPSIDSLYLLTETGTVEHVALPQAMIRHAGDFIGMSMASNPLFKEIVKDDQPRWSKTFLSVFHGGLVVAYGLREHDYILIGEVNLGYLTDFLRRITAEQDQLILVVDQAGQVVADNHGKFTAQQLNIGNLELVSRALHGEKLQTGKFDFFGTEMIGSISPIENIDWQILVAKSTSSLYHNVVNIGVLLLLGLLLALAVGVVVSYLVANKLAQRFGELTTHAQEVAARQASDDWPDSSIDEFKRLSGTLQAMAKQLQDSETLYRTLFEELPDGVMLWRKDGSRALQFNTAAHTILGYSREEFSRLSVRDFHVSSPEIDLAGVLRCLDADGMVRFEAVHRTKQQQTRTIDVTLQKLELVDQEMVLAIHRDMTEEKKAIAETEYLNELLSMFVKNSPVYTFIKEVSEQQSRVLLASENYRDMIGIPGSEMAGKTMAELFPDDLAQRMTADDWRVVSRGKTLEIEEELAGRSYASIKFPIIQGSRTLLAGYTIDITERKEAEEERLNLEKQLLHVQKLESLGVLAGGIAHDFNNILLAITGNVDMALRRLEVGNKPEQHLQRIKKAAGKAADLVRQMLDYSGKGTFKIEVLDLNRLLEEMMHILEVSISKSVHLSLQLDPQLPFVEGDATQLRQVIMNLVINASEAIADENGEIRITTGTCNYSRQDLQSLVPGHEIAAGEFVCLEVADDGSGMTTEVQDKLFDPFFSTKFTGRGLGMAAVQGIVRSHRGFIKVESEPGQGSRFRICLPVSEKELAAAEASKPQVWTGSGTILLVDDERSVRKIATEMLNELGFSVVEAEDGQEALEVYRSRADIDLVLLDLTMPNMDGAKCFRELMRIDPKAKVVMSSGYNGTGDTKSLMEAGLLGFIQKPYWLKTLRETLQSVFEAG